MINWREQDSATPNAAVFKGSLFIRGQFFIHGQANTHEYHILAENGGNIMVKYVETEKADRRRELEHEHIGEH